MKALGHEVRGDVSLIVLYLLVALPAQVWAALEGPIPWLNFGHGWASAVSFGLGAPIVAALLWRRHPRARMAAYVFFSFDAVRSTRLAHELPLAIDLALILYLQTPGMRRLYPSMWSRRGRWRQLRGGP